MLLHLDPTYRKSWQRPCNSPNVPRKFKDATMITEASTERTRASTETSHASSKSTITSPTATDVSSKSTVTFSEATDAQSKSTVTSSETTDGSSKSTIISSDTTDVSSKSTRVPMVSPEACVVEELQKFDCHPDRPIDKESCQKRGCCFRPNSYLNVIDSDLINSRFVGIPSCYFPNNYLGYELISNNSIGNELILAKFRRVTPSGFPKDVQLFELRVMCIDDNRLRIQDVQWNDIDYMWRHLDFTYDWKKFSGLPEFIKDLHDKGRHYVAMIEQDPAAIGSNVLEPAKNALKIRYYLLLPYLYTLFYMNHVYGHTVARPLFFDTLDPFDLLVALDENNFTDGELFWDDGENYTETS